MSQLVRRILIVEDDPIFRQLMIVILGREYEIRDAIDGKQALEILETWVPDVVLLDIVMPRMNGFETCRAIKAGHFHPQPQVVMVSGKSAIEEQIEAFEAGADDYLVKPIDRVELRSRVQLHFRLREAQEVMSESRRELEVHRDELKRIACERIQEIIDIQDLAIFTLAKVAEARDNETGMHLTRMREYSQVLARKLRADSPYSTAIDDRFLEDLYRSSPLHDIGKVGIPDAVLLKPGKLNEAEFEIMKQHAIIGANILEQAVMQSPSGGFLTMAAIIAKSHHERWDGGGYPAGSAGEAIPLPGRIVAVADVFDALTSKRPYKEPWPTERAQAHIEDQAGRHFDPIVVEAFRRSIPEFVKIQRTCGDEQSAPIGIMQFAYLPATPPPVHGQASSPAYLIPREGIFEEQHSALPALTAI